MGWGEREGVVGEMVGMECVFVFFLDLGITYVRFAMVITVVEYL